MGNRVDTWKRYAGIGFHYRAFPGVWQVCVTTYTGSKAAGTYVETEHWVTPVPNLIDHGVVGGNNTLLETAGGVFAIGDRALSIHPDAMAALNLTEVQIKSNAFRVRRTAEPTKVFPVKAVVPHNIIEGTPSYYELVVTGAQQ